MRKNISAKFKKDEIRDLQNENNWKPEQVFLDLIKAFNSVGPWEELRSFDDWLKFRVNFQNFDVSKIPLKNRSSIPGVTEHSLEVDFSNPGLVEEWLTEFKKYPALYDFLLAEGRYLPNIEDRLQTFLIARTFMIGITSSGRKCETQYPFYLALPGAFLKITAEGIKIETPYILELFRQYAEKGELTRIRPCVTCQKLFWAFRLDAKYCSKKCSNVYHQRRHWESEENRNRINERRRDNYQRNKKNETLRLIKGNKNGSL